jgi:antitoxin component YwqK of YwqJK toxin-antitoxin module
LSVSVLLCAAAVLCAACAGPGPAGARDTTRPTYDKATGKLKELTYDANQNGKIDTWTEMDGARPIRSRIDRDEDGRIDRWEYYDANGALAKVGYSRRQGDRPDAWAFSGADGQIARVDSSSTADEHRIDRREFYEHGVMARSESDTNGDGRTDQWETYEAGAVKTVAMDENGDGRPDRRLTYGPGGVLVSIESEPDASGVFQKRVAVR